jgi:tetratricopeptide (TPR) repeat protein
MLRAYVLLTLLTLTLRSALVPAIAGPLLADDLETCRNRQAEAGVRVAACEKLLRGGKLTGKDLAIALSARAPALMAKRDYDKAIATFSEASKADPDDPVPLIGRGWAYVQKGDDDHAMADFNQAIKLRPNAPMALNNRGTIYLRQGAVQNALDDFDAALKSNPNLFFARMNRGHVLMINKDYEGALAELAEAERIKPGEVGPQNYRCQTYAAMGQFDQALAVCNALIEKLPKLQYALVTRGDIHRAKGDLDAALKDYNVALGVNPNNARAHLGRGQLFEQRHDLAQARADYRSAGFALTPFEDIDTRVAKATARERLAVLTQAPGAVPSSRRIALIIGNSAYRNVHPLDNPQRDAKRIAGVLRDIGFQTVTLTNDLSRDKFFEALHAFGKDAEKADWAVVYYAGHGFEIGGVNYLVPVDARLAVDKDAETEAVALEQVIAAVGGARKLRLVILDACRDNPFAPTMRHTIELKLVDKGFSNIEPGAGFMVVYAAKHGETALDGEGGGSPFATVLARDIKEQKVEIRKLFDIVRDDVWTATQHQQQPFTYGSPPGREDFFFVAGK